MGCGGSKEAGPAPKGDRGDKFIPDTTIDDTGIEDFDKVFQKADDPLAGIIGMNNQFQTAIEQLMAAGSALFGANLTEASIKDGKLSIEIYKPPQEEKDKKVVIANVTGARKAKEPKDKGIEIKDAKLYEDIKNNEELLNALMDCNEQVGLFNTFMSKKEVKDVKVIVHCNRVKVDLPKPKDNAKELAKINMVKRAVNNFNTSFFPVKSGLAKAAFKDGLNISNVVKQIMDRLKEALKGMTPKVDVDVNGLMEGKLDFTISLPDAPDINTFIEKSDLLPPMLKKAWKHINGEGGMVDCLKDCATKLKELKPQVDEAVEAVKALPTDPDKIKEAAKKAVSDKKITPFDVPKIPGKMKNNGEQLSRTPEVLKEFMENLKTTLEDLVASLGGAAKDASGSSDKGAVMAVVAATKWKRTSEVKAEPNAEVTRTSEEKAQVEENSVTVEQPVALQEADKGEEEQVPTESKNDEKVPVRPETQVEENTEAETKVCC